MMNHNVFDVLGIEPTKNIQWIKQAFAEKTSQFHPEEYPEEWQEIYQAYQQALVFAKENESLEKVREPEKNTSRSTQDDLDSWKTSKKEGFAQILENSEKEEKRQLDHLFQQLEEIRVKGRKAAKKDWQTMFQSMEWTNQRGNLEIMQVVLDLIEHDCYKRNACRFLIQYFEQMKTDAYEIYDSGICQKLHKILKELKTTLKIVRMYAWTTRIRKIIPISMAVYLLELTQSGILVGAVFLAGFLILYVYELIRFIIEARVIKNGAIKKCEWYAPLLRGMVTALTAFWGMIQCRENLLASPIGIMGLCSFLYLFADIAELFIWIEGKLGHIRKGRQKKREKSESNGLRLL